MSLGVFDSGLGGLAIAKAIHAARPDLNMVYFGDTLHLPYGNRSEKAITAYTKQGVEFLFNQGCPLVVLACNSASAAALRTLQQQWLPNHYPDKRILGVIVPTLETVIERGLTDLGLLATNYVSNSRIYDEELQKLKGDVRLAHIPAPLLVPLIEYEGEDLIPQILDRYFSDINVGNLQALILGCTHYCLIKKTIRTQYPGLDIISQDDIIPPKLIDYLHRHPELDKLIGKDGQIKFFVSDITENYQRSAFRLFSSYIKLQQAEGLGIS